MTGSRIEKSLLAELAKAPGTIEELCERAFGCRQAVERTLRRLCTAELVQSERLPPTGKRGKSPFVYRLAA